MLFCAAVGAFLSLPALVLAQTGAAFDLTWNTVDGGGYTFSDSSSYSLGGTIGQADAGKLAAGGYTLAGGFWGGGEAIVLEMHIYLPLVQKTIY